VAGMDRNRCPESAGISVRHGPEYAPNLLNNSHKRSRIIFLKTIDMYDVSGKNHWIYGKAPCSSPRSAKNWGILRGFPITESITD
jgi:hypothetical protein